MKDYTFPPDIDTLVVQVNVGVGKTNTLFELLKTYEDKRILFVSFRVTLCKDLIERFYKFKFHLYSEIEGVYIDSKNYKKVVCQLDSLYRVMGEFDLVIFDEFIYTINHLFSFVKYKQAVYEAIEFYIKEPKNVIILDALYNENYNKYLETLNRKVCLHINEYKKMEDYEVIYYKQKEMVTKKMFE